MSKLALVTEMESVQEQIKTSPLKRELLLMSVPQLTVYANGEVHVELFP